MNSIRVYTVLFCCFFIQVQCAIPSSNDKNVEDIIDIAKAVLQALEKIVDDVTSVSLVTLENLQSVVKSLKTMILKAAKVEIGTIGSQIFAKLDELKKEANIIFVDIIDCTEDREKDIEQLLVTFLNKTGDCTVKRVDEVLDSLAVVVKDIENVNDDVKNITVRLENCQNVTDVTACIIKVIEDAENAAADIPAKVIKDVNEAKKKVDELEDYLFECDHDNVNELEVKSQEIYNGIVECVEGKLLKPSVMNIP